MPSEKSERARVALWFLQRWPVYKKCGGRIRMEDDVIEFLQQSNYIEGVRDSIALDHAISAWQHITNEKKLTLQNILSTHDILMKGKLAAHLRGKLRIVNVRIGNRLGFPPRSLKKAMTDWIEAANLTLMMPKETIFNSLEKMEAEIQKDHIMFEKIHPFIDGNGRMGRIIMNWQRIKIGLPILVICEEERFEYYKIFE